MFYCVIPARYGASRLPGKPLLEIAGQPMVEHVRRAALASGARAVVVATDHEQVRARIEAAGGIACMTRAEHASGTDRIAEVADLLGWAEDDIVVNVQGDEPLLPPAVIDQVAAELAAHPDCGVATLCEPIAGPGELADPNAVKVVVAAGRALYFSRAPIPWARDLARRGAPPLDARCPPLRHIGLYAYRVAALRRFTRWPVAPLEAVEALEQLRFLVNGVPIRVAVAAAPVPAGVDTPEDLARVREGFGSRAP
jgi:3-deoxy-manno-octulosonate cytidylyltransferase (CMP-KDO synthetase)